jgi:hypothetical protein
VCPCQKWARKLERVKGIEPSYSAWKAATLPLSYTRDSFLRRRAKRVPRACEAISKWRCLSKQGQHFVFAPVEPKSRTSSGSGNATTQGVTGGTALLDGVSAVAQKRHMKINFFGRPRREKP